MFAASVQVAGNDNYDSPSFTPIAAGVYQWVAGYSGDTRNKPAGPTRCNDAAEAAIVRQAAVDPVATAFSTTASPSPRLGAPVYDVAHLRGGLDPGGTITFELFGPDDQSCAGPPAFTATALVNGNGDYRSPVFIVPRPGTYRWVATYSGDIGNIAVGPTACTDSAESAVVGADPGPDPNDGPNHGPNVPSRTRSPHPAQATTAAGIAPAGARITVARIRCGTSAPPPPGSRPRPRRLTVDSPSTDRTAAAAVANTPVAPAPTGPSRSSTISSTVISPGSRRTVAALDAAVRAQDPRAPKRREQLLEELHGDVAPTG